MLSGCKSYRFSVLKLSLYMVKAMLSREEVVEKSEKGVFSSFSVPLFLLVCIFLLTKLKRPNDENVLFLDIYHIANFIAADSVNPDLK